MRAIRSLAGGFTTISHHGDRPWLPGLPHAAAVLATIPVFGATACVTGLLLAALTGFIVYLPLTALWLNGGRAIAYDAPPPALTRGAQALLFGLWTATAWLGAWASAATG